MRIYLASGFFTPEQVEVVEAIEKVARKRHHLFSPREGTKLGSGLGKNYEERKKSAEEIYERNVKAMNSTDVMVAVVDGSDAGTMFEMGYYAAKSKPIIAYTALDKGLNIMLQEAVVALCRGPVELERLLDSNSVYVLKQKSVLFRKFNKDMI